MCCFPNAEKPVFSIAAFTYDNLPDKIVLSFERLIVGYTEGRIMDAVARHIMIMEDAKAIFFENLLKNFSSGSVARMRCIKTQPKNALLFVI